MRAANLGPARSVRHPRPRRLGGWRPVAPPCGFGYLSLLLAHPRARPESGHFQVNWLQWPGPKPTSSPRRCVCCRHPTAQSPPPGVARKKPHPQSPGVLDEKSQPAGLFALVRDQPGPAQQPAGPIRSTKHLQKHSFGRDCWGLLESQGLVRNCWDPTV